MGDTLFLRPNSERNQDPRIGVPGISLQPHRVVLYKDDQTNYVFFIYQISSNTVAVTTRVIHNSYIINMIFNS